MSVVIACPAGHRLKVPNKYKGRRIVCPVCDARMDVPGDELPMAPVASISAKPEPKPIPPIPEQVNEPASIPLSVPDVLTEQDPPTDPLPVEPSRVAPKFSESTFELPSESDSFDSFQIDTESIGMHEMGDAKSAAKDVGRSYIYTVLMLAIASILMAIFCLVPSVVEQKLSRQIGLRSPDAWSYVVMLVAVIQIAVSTYAIRIPDWSTAWLLTILATAVAALYAAGLAMTMFASRDHAFVRQLGLLDEVERYRAQPWCFFVLCVALILAYCCGRFSVRWHQSEMQVAGTR